MLLELRRLLPAGELHPPQPLQGGKVDDEGVVAAEVGLVSDPLQVFWDEPLDGRGALPP